MTPLHTPLTTTFPPALIGLALLVAVTGCGSDDPGPAPQTLPEPEPVVFGNLLAEDHPLADGQRMFLHETWGAEKLEGWPPADFMLDLMEDAEFGPQYERFGFIRDPEGEFPVGFGRGAQDPQRVHERCALCHVARLPDGTAWLGAPSNTLDFDGFRAAVNDRWVASGGEPLISELMQEKLPRLGPGRTRAETATFTQVVAARFPPYFDLDRRTALNYLGTGSNVRTEVFFALFSFGLGEPNDEEALVPFPDAEAEVLAEFMGTLRAPPAPAPADPARVDRGEQVFSDARCDDCHHSDVADDFVITVDKEPEGLERYPGDDPAFERGSIRTSRLHRILVDGDPEMEFGTDTAQGDNRGNLIQFLLSRGLQSKPTDGYRPANLKGLWQRAPYLHNGSVPSLEDLLKPVAERPTSFMVGEFLVDTSLPENKNVGHEFGVELSADDKQALVAYLMCTYPVNGLPAR